MNAWLRVWTSIRDVAASFTEFDGRVGLASETTALPGVAVDLTTTGDGLRSDKLFRFI